MINIENKDCVDFLKTLPDQSIDLVLIDPPYNINKSFKNDSLDLIQLEMFTKSYIEEIRRVIKPRRPILIFYNSGENLLEYMKIVGSILNFKKLMVLYKPNDCSMPLKSVLRTSEALLLFNTGGALTYDQDTFTHDVIVQNVKVASGFYHPTVKNVGVIRKLVTSFSIKGNLVLDCFAGSGTTALACKETGRNFTGCEIDKKYFKICQDRLKQKGL